MVALADGEKTVKMGAVARTVRSQLNIKMPL